MKNNSIQLTIPENTKELVLTDSSGKETTILHSEVGFINKEDLKDIEEVIVVSDNCIVMKERDSDYSIFEDFPTMVFKDDSKYINISSIVKLARYIVTPTKDLVQAFNPYWCNNTFSSTSSDSIILNLSGISPSHTTLTNS